MVLEIRPNGTFTQKLFSCDGREPIDSGHWSISKGQLKLTTLTFELIRFDNIYFLIPPVDREKFKKDFSNALKTAKKNSDNELSFSGKVLWAIHDEYYMKVGQ